MDTYKIVRFYSDGRPNKTIRRGVSLQVAQLHCNDQRTRGVLRSGVRWFDGYTKE